MLAQADPPQMLGVVRVLVSREPPKWDSVQFNILSRSDVRIDAKRFFVAVGEPGTLWSGVAACRTGEVIIGV